MEFLRDTQVKLWMWLVACHFVTGDYHAKEGFNSGPLEKWTRGHDN